MDTGSLVVDDGRILQMPDMPPPVPKYTINGINTSAGQPVVIENPFFDGDVGVIVVEVVMAGADLTTIHHHLTGDILMRNHSSIKPTMMHDARDSENVGIITFAFRRQEVGGGRVQASVEYDTRTQLIQLSVWGEYMVRREYHVYADLLELCYDTTPNLLKRHLPLLSDQHQQHGSGKRQLHHKVISFSNALQQLFTDLSPEQGADVPKLSMTEALNKFRPALQSFLNYKPWSSTLFYINQQGRPNTDVIQQGVKVERQQVHPQISYLIENFNSIATDSYDIDLLNTANKKVHHQELYEQVTKLAQAAMSHNLGGFIGHVRKQVIPNSDPREVIVIDDSDDEEEEEPTTIAPENDEDMMVWDDASIDWDTLLDE